MKPAALEAHKELAIQDIEVNLDALLNAMGISYEQPVPPVRNPNYRQLQTLERINEKLALVLKASDIAPVREKKAAVLSEPEPEAPVQVPEPPADETPEAAQLAEAGTPEPEDKPDVKKKSKSK